MFKIKGQSGKIHKEISVRFLRNNLVSVTIGYEDWSSNTFYGKKMDEGLKSRFKGLLSSSRNSDYLESVFAKVIGHDWRSEADPDDYPTTKTYNFENGKITEDYEYYDRFPKAFTEVFYVTFKTPTTMRGVNAFMKKICSFFELPYGEKEKTELTKCFKKALVRK